MATPAQRLQADRLRFEGMLPAEVLVFKAWLSQHEKEYDRFLYNLRLGPGIEPPPGTAEYWRDLAIKSTQLRTDAVAYRGDQPTLIEVKRRATAGNISQLLVYYHVWITSFPLSPPPKLIMVCNSLTPNILPLLQATNIRLDQVEADFSQLRPTTFGRRGGITTSTPAEE